MIYDISVMISERNYQLTYNEEYMLIVLFFQLFKNATDKRDKEE